MRKTLPTLLFTSVALAFGAHAQAPSNSPSNNPSRNTTMQPGSTAVTPQARLGASGNVISPNPNPGAVRMRNFVEVQPGVFREVFIQDAATVETSAAQAAGTTGATSDSAIIAASEAANLSWTNGTGVLSGSAVAVDTFGNVVGSVESVTTPGTEPALRTPELDKAVAREKARRAQRVAINGQSWNMIIPRTEVDRTHQMRDDPPSPILQQRP